MLGIDQRAFRTACLKAHIHFDAFVRAPVRYLAATWWWVCRKRVRARARYAPLLAKSPRAYELWILQQEQEEPRVAPEGGTIIALVASTAGDGKIDATLASLTAEGIPAHVIGPDARADLQRLIAEIDWKSDPWFLPMAAGDELAKGAANAYRQSIVGCASDLIYADEDLLDSRGRRTAPQLKPDWNSELFLHSDYLTGSCIVRNRRGALAAAAETADWPAELVRSAAEGGEALHIRRILHHRRTRRSPPLPMPALQIAPRLPRVSIIIPTRNRADLLSNCIAGVRAAGYPDLEVIVVDNDSDDAETIEYLARISNDGINVIGHSGTFNYSAINNRAVAEATGELICLLNNDIEAVSNDWVQIMATQSLRDDVGAVGAQLLYPDGRIQHAGVALGIGNAAGHAHRFQRPEEEGYFKRHLLPQFVSAVSAACLMVRRDRFLAVGGLDEIDFQVAFNDVDLCLKLNARGWQSLYEPRATLIHHESVSRGFDKDPVGAARLAREMSALQRRWHTHEIVDPFHHPRLSRASEQFVLAM